jgi:hypothetical protein
MRCLYYLAPSLRTTQKIAGDLHDVGVDDFFLHVIAKDEAGLRKHEIHSSNYLETLDVIREGFIGAVVGFIVGMIGVSLMMYLGAFPNTPTLVYVALVGVATCFGAWEGGLIGVGRKNKKLQQFEADIEAGKFLILVYAHADQEDAVRDMMRNRHLEADLVAIDRRFVNPFTSVARRKRSKTREKLLETRQVAGNEKV